MTRTADGQPFDWTRITAGNFVVHIQKHRPRYAEVAVPYRGYWFYEVVIALQESDGKSAGPLLTLPIGGRFAPVGRSAITRRIAGTLLIDRHDAGDLVDHAPLVPAARRHIPRARLQRTR